MSDKDRQKKDGQNKDKKNQARREDNFNQRRLEAQPKHEAKDESNLTDTETVPGDDAPSRRRSGRPPMGGATSSDQEAKPSLAPQSARAHASKTSKGK